MKTIEKLIFAAVWLWVIIPLAWGVYQSFKRILPLFFENV